MCFVLNESKFSMEVVDVNGGEVVFPLVSDGFVSSNSSVYAHELKAVFDIKTPTQLARKIVSEYTFQRMKEHG